MNRFLALWRTTTVRLTAWFILLFVVFSVGLLGYMAFQSSYAIQQQQMRDIDHEIRRLHDTERRNGLRGLALAVQRLANRPGPGIYYLGDNVGQMLVGNVNALPAEILSAEGTYTFDYERDDAFSAQRPFDQEFEDERPDEGGFALVKTTFLDSGLRLVVGRDIVERRGFTAIIFGGLAIGVIGIVILSAVAGGLTSMRVLRRIDSITETSKEIMSGNLSQRVPITKRNDEFDQLASSLNEMLDRIEQLMQGLKEVTDNVAHDLKTPLTRLRNRAEAALRDEEDAQTPREALKTSIAESDQLIRTFNALLLIARVEAGTPSGALANVNAGDIVTDVADLYAPVIEEAGAELVCTVGDKLNVSANRELLGQALVNLVENAIKYATASSEDVTSAPDNEITISARRDDDEIVIEVSDHGPGIPAADRQRVLERFVRLEKSRTEPGSGLGLALVAAVANLHKGSLELADNAPGVRAILTLPAN